MGTVIECTVVFYQTEENSHFLFNQLYPNYSPFGYELNEYLRDTVPNANATLIILKIKDRFLDSNQRDE